MLKSMQQQKPNGSYYFLETAGGIHSPVMSGTPQVDFYRSLRLPTVLIGDSHLGGISTTLTSFESLKLRGYDIPAVLLFDQPKYRNHTLIEQRVHQESLVATVPPPPAFLEDPVLELESMKRYYEQLDHHLEPILQHLDLKHQERFDRLDSMAQKSRDIFWWPFTQHKLVGDVTVIDSAYQDYFTTYDKKGEPKEMFDSCASWWTQGLGHGNPELALTASYAAGRYGHVIFPESTNEPALALAEKVLEKDLWASRVFFSDNGSTAMEVALKMGMSAAAKRYGWDMKAPVEILGIDGSYHGDTIGVMNACSPNTFNDQVQWYQPLGHWLKPPSVHLSQGKSYVRLPSEMGHAEDKVYKSLDDIYTLKEDPKLTEIYGDYIRRELKTLKDQNRKIGALLMEPLLMGSGGMVFVDPLFQRTLIDIVRSEGSQRLFGVTQQNNTNSWNGLPVIFDEVFSGWYRLGRRSASEFLGVDPDITAYAKTLTGGLLPLALTVTGESIYDIFLSESKPECLLHGHSYTAHPMGCSVAKKSIEVLDRLNTTHWNSFRDNWSETKSIWSMWSPSVVNQLSNFSNVESLLGYGSLTSKSIVEDLRHGVFNNGLDGTEKTGVNLFARPLGNVVYLMASQVTTPQGIHQCEKAFLKAIKTHSSK
ncbi:pyridoxal phosphate-dependent transferase [Sporodiniella umbellata]|nr:pyridoxal phosphate-dependent transferase [Sporodiniella umbellata]